MKIRIGTRSSPLALKQVDIICNELRKIDKSIEFEIVKITTKGDRILDKSLSKIGGKGLFIKEIEEALLNNEIDIAVHSYKDFALLDDRFEISAVLERESPYDVLVSNHGKINELPKNAKIGTSSLRRAYQLKLFRNDIEIIPIRGNINTRLKKLQELDGIVLAHAGIKRLGYDELITEIIDEDVIIPAAAQGAIAIETLRSNPIDIVKKLNHVQTQKMVDIEREFIIHLNGNCQTPIAAFANNGQFKCFAANKDYKILNLPIKENIAKIAAKQIIAEIGEINV